jgi:hypothetical protein|eukprot:SAG25_NODE_173_length_12920_cov_18.688168_10_plen_63_part_00
MRVRAGRYSGHITITAASSRSSLTATMAHTAILLVRATQHRHQCWIHLGIVTIVSALVVRPP